MAIRARDFDNILSKWLQTREGKEAVYQAANVSPYTDAQMRAMAQELSDMIVDAYLSVVRHSGKYFDRSTIHVGIPRQGRNGSTRLRVTFDAKGLARRSYAASLQDVDGLDARLGGPLTPYRYRTEANGIEYYFTGKGVYDIIGLLTQGYGPVKTVYGYWWDNRNDNEGALSSTINRRQREGDDFVTRAVNAFKAKYPGVEVEYPKLWGGTK